MFLNFARKILIESKITKITGNNSYSNISNFSSYSKASQNDKLPSLIYKLTPNKHANSSASSHSSNVASLFKNSKYSDSSISPPRSNFNNASINTSNNSSYNSKPSNSKFSNLDQLETPDFGYKKLNTSIRKNHKLSSSDYHNSNRHNPKSLSTNKVSDYNSSHVDPHTNSNQHHSTIVSASQKNGWIKRKSELNQKLGKQPWNPQKKLARASLEKIRLLNKEYPNIYTINKLSQDFKVSFEAIRRILKSKFVPDQKRALEQESRRKKSITEYHLTKKDKDLN
ncbi:Required for respiratory growth protein 9, mitochondrial [Smittium culicis]|uniref:Required for respiratory growth protein 9, mitochondrial n=1 Tax=Smittium culicis TaxID=133412 RepID=A0A1R1YFV0_9FUNG|nr:Required for respiratory growth protein 9, mitochondrial [Smittium culicis]OMJ25801.1 Required for respiratory growth protein 9, mitochondrial [Smittium culicis]